ncbi:hypothetical protein ACF1CG_13730 [Streptomyces sp. NPDC014773]|uniref:hypothetical protein n=1 Tax=Streptomyces sp. NPDC014773 TaxID=3364908 RepID=UPI0036F80F39
MTVFLCSKCGAAITSELAELAAVPDFSVGERDRDKETRRAPSTIPQGRYAIDPEPWGPPTSCRTIRTTPSRLSREGIGSVAKKASSSRRVAGGQ